MKTRRTEEQDRGDGDGDGDGDGLSMGDGLDAALRLLAREEGRSKGGADVRRACPC